MSWLLAASLLAASLRRCSAQHCRRCCSKRAPWQLALLMCCRRHPLLAILCGACCSGRPRAGGQPAPCVRTGKPGSQCHRRLCMLCCAVWCCAVRCGAVLRTSNAAARCLRAKARVSGSRRIAAGLAAVTAALTPPLQGFRTPDEVATFGVLMERMAHIVAVKYKGSLKGAGRSTRGCMTLNACQHVGTSTCTPGISAAWHACRRGLHACARAKSCMCTRMPAHTHACLHACFAISADLACCVLLLLL